MITTPRTFMLGYTTVDEEELVAYLRHTDQESFFLEYRKYVHTKQMTPGEALCSIYAKICYKSLVLGKNQNVSKIRDMPDNFQGVMDSGHGAVFEHCWLNFITTGCSRVFTHELVRHRVGTAFSQTSGRYVTLDENLEVVLPPELLEPYNNDPEVRRCIDAQIENVTAAAKFLRKRLIEEVPCPNNCTDGYISFQGNKIKCNECETGTVEVKDFATKKKITSAIRRIAPNGQSNEIGWSVNIRSLRHLLELRTSRHAEWEIRYVFAEVADIIERRFPLMLCGATKEMVDGLPEYKGLKV